MLLPIATVITNWESASVQIIADSPVREYTSTFRMAILLSVIGMVNHYNSYSRGLPLESSREKVMVMSPVVLPHKYNSRPSVIVVAQVYLVQSSLFLPSLPSLHHHVLPSVQKHSSDPQDDDILSPHNSPSHPHHHPATTSMATPQIPPENTLFPHPHHHSTDLAVAVHTDDIPDETSYSDVLLLLHHHCGHEVTSHRSDSMVVCHSRETQLRQRKNERGCWVGQ